MSRLIDADAFKEKVGTDTTLRKTICEIIDKQPTAYDVEKVVERLEKVKEKEQPEINGKTTIRDLEVFKMTVGYTIEIVRNAGKDGAE